MPRGIPKKKMSINDKRTTEKEVITADDVGDLKEVLSNEQTEDTRDNTEDSSVVEPVVESEEENVAPLSNKHPSNIFSYNWDIVPLGDEVFSYTNQTTGFSFEGSMKQFNEILKG